MMRPVNIVQGKYFLGTDPLPEDPKDMEIALTWYRKGVKDGENW